MSDMDATVGADGSVAVASVSVNTDDRGTLRPWSVFVLWALARWSRGFGGRLEHLEIRESNAVRLSGMQVLSAKLEHNHRLHTLVMGGNNQIGIDGVRALGKVLRSNRTLRTISIGGRNNIAEPEARRILAESLAHNHTLQTFLLEANDHVCPEFMSAMVTSMRQRWQQVGQDSTEKVRPTELAVLRNIYRVGQPIELVAANFATLTPDTGVSMVGLPSGAVCHVIVRWPRNEKTGALSTPVQPVRWWHASTPKPTTARHMIFALVP